MNIETWDFGDTVGEDRRANLEAVASFDEIVSQISKTMTVLCCERVRCRDCPDPKEFYRIVYCVSVCRPVFDVFFNSRHGYRAAYYRSPYEGLRANSLLLDALLPSLLNDEATHRSGVNVEFIRDSLTSLSAKAWLAEPSFLCTECPGEWDQPDQPPVEIRNERWEHFAEQKARWGCTAPYYHRIRLFGAFLNDAGDEWIRNEKRNRHIQIHKWGWS
jgi:hypothetical protein